MGFGDCVEFNLRISLIMAGKRRMSTAMKALKRKQRNADRSGTSSVQGDEPSDTEMVVGVDTISDHLEAVRVQLSEPLPQVSVVELVSPIGWLDMLTVSQFIHIVIRTAQMSYIVVEPLIWQLLKAAGDGMVDVIMGRIGEYIVGDQTNWTRLMIPVVTSDHHILCVYERDSQVCHVHNSLGGVMPDLERGMVKLLVRAVHPGSVCLFYIRPETMRQRDGNSCGVIACFTACQLLMGQSVADPSFDPIAYRTVIQNTIVNGRLWYPRAIGVGTSGMPDFIDAFDDTVAIVTPKRRRVRVKVLKAPEVVRRSGRCIIAILPRVTQRTWP